MLAASANTENVREKEKRHGETETTRAPLTTIPLLYMMVINSRPRFFINCVLNGQVS